jgi:DNA topoisomerase I
MSMKLFIVESPAKAKTIGKYLGSEYIVKASIGHVRDLPKSNKQAIDIEKGFIPTYIVDKKKQDVVDELRSLGKKASEVILATDPDREGEAIAWHLLDECKFKNANRVTYQEITESAIKEALNHKREIDMNLKEAQEARRVLDRLVGYDLSGVIWKKVRYGLSAGRVQSPALRILCEREREINAFIPESYFVLEGTFLHKKKNHLIASSKDIFKVEKKTLDDLKVKAQNLIWSIQDKKISEASLSPKAPFTTSTLQQAASSRLGMQPSRTMRAAQKLYEAGLITYMRTDSTSLSVNAQSEIIDFVNATYGASHSEKNTYKTKSKNAQEAHEAIRPTNIKVKSSSVGKDESSLYELIWKRTLTSQMKPARYERTSVVIGAAGFDYPLSLNGSKILYSGWLMADPDGKGEDVILPDITVNEILDLENLKIESKETSAPNRFSEAGLIKELEKRGIGRPSTYASIISTIVDREYVSREAKSLKPTDTGMVVSEFLENNFAAFISDDFTASMEDKLDDIAEGKSTYKKVLTDFYGPFLIQVKEKEKGEKATNLGEAPSDISCPKCSSSMIIKLAKNGKFYSCSKYPDCVGALKLDGSEMEGPKDLGRLCPKCEKHNLIERDGKNGLFVACAGYPKCKYVEKSQEQIEREKDGVKCTDCKDGVMIERRGRFGIFYSCTNYPKCKNAIKTKPTGNLCLYKREDGKGKIGDTCGHLMMEGTKTIPERCSDKTCPNHRPDKL